MSETTQPVGTYCGHPRYACPFCAYDTLDADNFAEHVRVAHPVYEAKPVKPAVPMVVSTRTMARKPAPKQPKE